MNVATSNWDLTTFIDLDKYNQQWDFIERYLTKTEQVCRNISHLSDSNCNHLLFMVNSISRQLKEKRALIYNSVGHSPSVTKRSIIATVSTIAQTLYGLCDFSCIQKYDFGIGRLISNAVSSLKFDREQLKVVRLKDGYEGRENYDIKMQINELRNVTVEQQIINFVNKHFIYMNLLLTKHLSEIDTLFTIIESAKLGQIHPYLLSASELLSQFQDIRLSLPTGLDLPFPLNIKTVYDILKLSDLTVYYSNNNIVFVMRLPLIYQNVLYCIT